MDIKQRIVEINNLHELDLTMDDVHIFDGVLYLSSVKSAKLLRATFHSFSNEYVPVLIKSGVRRMILGRAKWYSFDDLEKLLRKARDFNKSVFDICEREIKKKEGARKKK